MHRLHRHLTALMKGIIILQPFSSLIKYSDSIGGDLWLLAGAKLRAVMTPLMSLIVPNILLRCLVTVYF